MANRTPGYIDGRRMRVGGVPLWGPVPNVLTPGTEEAYGIFEDFIGIEDVAAAATLAMPSGAWDFFVVVGASIAQSDLAGGAFILTTDAFDEDSGQVTLGSAASGGAFFPLADKHLWFEARVKAHDLVPTDFHNYFIGLVDPKAAAILPAGAGAFAFNDILGFCAQDGDANWSNIGRKVAVEDLNPLGVGYPVDNGWHRFGFYIDGVTSVKFYYDRAYVTGQDTDPASIPVVGLMPSIAVRTGDPGNAADSIEVDYIMCVQLR